MKSTGTKRILSVLSAGALVATMSAIPAFAAEETKGEVTNINITGLKAATIYAVPNGVADATAENPSIFPDAGTVKINVDKTTENVFDAPASYDLSGLTDGDWEITGGNGLPATANSLPVGTYTVTLKKSAIEEEVTASNITYEEGGNPSNNITVSVPDSFTMPSFTIEVKEKSIIQMPTNATASIRTMAPTDAKAAIAGKFDLPATVTCNNISDSEESAKAGTDDADNPLTVGKTYYAKCEAKTPTGNNVLPADSTFIVKVTVEAEGTLPGTKNMDFVHFEGANVDALKTAVLANVKKVEGVMSTITDSQVTVTKVKSGSTETNTPGGTVELKEGDIATVTVNVLSHTENGYKKPTTPTPDTITYTVKVVKSSSNNDDNSSDTGNSSDTAPDFTEKEMTSSTVSGNTFTHPEADVLQNKLNNNKGTTISIGEVKSGTASVATFAVTLPKNSGNVSENKVAQVINVLNTISTKSASKNAQSAVNELMKSADDKNTASMPISFSKSMADFGMTVSVTVPVTSKFTNGGTTLYYYNSSTKKLEAQKTTVAIRGGKATFDLTHASEYFLIQGVKDLSAGEGTNDSEDTLSSTEATTVATSEAPVVTAPEVTEPAPVDTTVPSVATNPGTGNAPIALAAIPVAIAAAAIIGKKMK